MAGDVLAQEGEAYDRRPSGYTDTLRGPSWRDAYALCQEIESQYDVELHFRVSPDGSSQRWAVPVCRVVVIALRVRKHEKDSIAGCAWFGGNGGARTMPAAWIAALYALEERMTDPSQAWLPPRYPLS